MRECGEGARRGYRIEEPLSKFIEKAIVWYNGIIEIWPRLGARSPHKLPTN